MRTPACIRSRPWSATFLLLGLCAATTAQGQPRLVRDIHPQTSPCSASSDPAFGVTLGSLALFSTNTGGLYRTDGTTAGTAAVRDPEEVGAARLLTRVGNLVLFPSWERNTGYEMWRSDGTAPGTWLLRDIQPGSASALDFNFDGPPVALGSIAVFVASDPQNGRQLWRTDGTTAGTTLVGGLPPGASVATRTQLGRAGLRVFLQVQTPTAFELWRSDGTTAGTTRVAALGGLEFVGELQGNLLFVNADQATGGELWRSDGTAAGTWLLRDINPGSASSQPRALTNLGGQFLFWANDGVLGAELWRTDGTAAGTQLVADIWPGPTGAGQFTWLQPDFAVLGNRLLFAASDPTGGNELWSTDGTAAGTRQVSNIIPGAGDAQIGRLRSDGAHVWLIASDGVTGRELWRTDGTAAGTRLVKDINPGPADSRPQAEALLNGVLLFSADDGVLGRELWRSDGTTAGTRLVRDIATCGGDGSYPNALLADPRGTATLYFAASDGVSGFEPWRSDGTAAGTVQVSDVQPGPGGSNPGAFVRVGDQAMFAVGFQLWRTDGTSAGTTQVPSPAIPHWMVASWGNQLYFAGFTLPNGIELWRTDGTAAGTVLVRDISPGQAWSAPIWALPWRGELWFSADDGANGRELMRTNGTAAGTTLLADIQPGSAGSEPKGLIALGDALLFAARTTATGEELWRTDSTTAGTTMVLDINPGPASSFPNSPAVVGTTLFFTAEDGVHGFELWRSDGTAAGTSLVADLRIGAAGSAPRLLTAVGNLLLFAADDGIHGLELWRSDGTPGGTQLVVDLHPGPGSGLRDSQILAPPGAGRAVFFGSDAGSGREIWATDGTATGTTVVDLVPGGQSSSPSAFARAGNTVFFVANDSVTGVELWAMRAMALAAPYGDSCGTTRFPRIAGAGGPPALGNGSFAVRVDGAPTAAPAGLFLGRRRIEAQLGGGCALAVDGLFLWVLTLTDGTGGASIALPVPNDTSLVGGRLFTQWAVAEAGGPLFGQGTLSSGLEIVLSDR